MMVLVAGQQLTSSAPTVWEPGTGYPSSKIASGGSKEIENYFL